MKTMFAFVLAVAAFRADAAEAPPQPTTRDFFVFACMQEYRKQHDIPLYDGSLGYAVEHVAAAPESLDALYAAAKAVAASLPGRPPAKPACEPTRQQSSSPSTWQDRRRIGPCDSGGLRCHASEKYCRGW